MNLFFTAVVPILLTMGLGTYLRHGPLPQEHLWSGLERLTYFVFTPALFVSSIASADLSVVSLGPLLVSLVLPVLIVSLVAVLGSRVILGLGGPETTSVLQGSIRLNTYIGLVFAQALHGAEGVAAFALACAVMVPLVNVACVSALAVYGDHASNEGRPRLIRQLISHPYIQACAAGLTLNIVGVGLPKAIGPTLEVFAAPALACGTLAAGAALVWRIPRHHAVAISGASLLKLAALPALAGAVAHAAGASDLARDSIVFICALPVAPSAFVLAARLGGHVPLMTATTAIQTLLASATVPVVLALTSR